MHPSAVRSALAQSLLFTVLVGAGCSADAPLGGVAGSPCAADLACTCDDGADGTAACVDGIADECVCDAADAAGDAGDDDAGADIGGVDAVEDTGGDDVGDAGDTAPDAAPCEAELYWPDLDGDGFGDQRATPERTCEPQTGWRTVGGDCDDADPFVFPAAPELCDDVDNDCDGAVDDGITVVAHYLDADGDGFGDPEQPPVFDCGRIEGRVLNDDDCDDDDEAFFPDAEDTCDGLDQDCDGDIDDDADFVVYWPDGDGDGWGDAASLPIAACTPPAGYVDNPDDCNDADNTILPGAVEVCDRIDNDCDDRIDEGTDLLVLFPDSDSDGFGDVTAAPTFSCTPIPGTVGNNRDCNDGDTTVAPGRAELCNDIDDDCDGLIDDSPVDAPTWYLDADGDGAGDADRPLRSCLAPANHVADDRDCDDRDDEAYPDADEICDGVDNDCDDAIDEGLVNACGTCGPEPTETCGNFVDDDCDGDVDESDDGCFCDGRTMQPCYTGAPHTLGIGACRGGVADCVCPGGARFCDDGAWGACIGEVLPGVETCNMIDDDCDGLIDEGLRNACGECAPERIEVCDGVDNDCDGLIDEGLRLDCGLCPGEEAEETCGDELDNDCDGYVDEGCVCDAELVACYPGPPATRGVGECADGERACYVGIGAETECVGYRLPTAEVCNGRDDDCDGEIDESDDGCSVCGVGVETCDGVDNDCDGQIDEGLRNPCGACLADVTPEELGGPALCNGLDDDCDGFVDELLVNACGTCDESCYTDDWDTDDEFDDGEFDSVDASDGLRLDSSTSTFTDLWVANTADDTVTRIDTRTGSVIGTYAVDWIAGRNNDNPSRTAVDFDGNAWVANRAFGGQASVAKIRGGDCVTDCVEFVVPVGANDGVARALAIDANGDVWVGLHNARQAIRLSVDDGRVLETISTPLTPYGFAVDRDNVLWMAGASSELIAAYDIDEGRFLGTWRPGGCSFPYGIAIDDNGDIWTGNWTCNHMVFYDRASILDDTIPDDIRIFSQAQMTSTRGVAIDSEGYVWMAASASDRVGRYDPVAGTWQTYPVCDQPTGVGIAPDGNVWAVCLGNDRAHRLTADGTFVSETMVGDQPYSYSDLTGFQLRNFTAPAGTWRGIFDCGHDECLFDTAEWNATVPPGTSARLRFRSSYDRATWTAWTSQVDTSPADLRALGVLAGRYLQIEVALSTTSNDLTPVVTGLYIDWQRP